MTGVNASRQLFDLDCMGEMAESVIWDFPPRPPRSEGAIVDGR